MLPFKESISQIPGGAEIMQNAGNLFLEECVSITVYEVKILIEVTARQLTCLQHFDGNLSLHFHDMLQHIVVCAALQRTHNQHEHEKA